ncbi:MAG: hypothetical protein WCZ98_01415 [Sideroxydans sp.]
MCFNSDSQQQSTTDSSIGSHNVDGSVNSNSGPAISNSGSNNTTNILDGGAIKGAFDVVMASNATSSDNYGRLLSTTSDALSGILGGIASTQNFISSTQAQASGQMDNRTKMIIGVSALAVVALLVWSNKQ